MRDHMVFGAAVAIILSAAPQVARAEWIICNRSAEELNVAIAYANLSGQIVTHGWWPVRSCGGCATVLQTNETGDRGTTYLYARTGSGAAYIQGDASFCTADSGFKYRSTPNCAMKSNFRQETVDLNKHFTTNITGKSSTGRTCF